MQMVAIYFDILLSLRAIIIGWRTVGLKGVGLKGHHLLAKKLLGLRVIVGLKGVAPHSPILKSTFLEKSHEFLKTQQKKSEYTKY